MSKGLKKAPIDQHKCLWFTGKCRNISFSNGFQVRLENIWKVCQNQFASRHETKQSRLASSAAIVAFFGQFQSAITVDLLANIECFVRNVYLEFVVSLRHAVKVSFFQNKLNAVDKVEIEIS